MEEHGFRTLVLNRTRRSENGKGLVSRWYPEALVARIATIRQYADRLVFLEGDGMKALPTILRGWNSSAAEFLHPPYAAGGGKRAGTRLYAHSRIDHEALFSILAENNANFPMTYDASPEIVDLVHRYGFDAVRLFMKNSRHARMPELVITSEPLFA